MAKKDGIKKMYRRLQKAIKPYGLEIRHGERHHAGIYNEAGERVYSLPSSPRVLHHAENYAMQSLRTNGHVPPEATL